MKVVKNKIKDKLNVALIFGGRSEEHDVSILSATSVFNYLNREKFNVLSIYINRRGNWRIVKSPLLSKEEMETGTFYSFLSWGNSSSPHPIKPDIYFPLLHGPFGEDGTIQGLFELAGVPYVGAGVTASALGMDKALAKDVWQKKGLPVAKYKVLMKYEWEKNKAILLKEIVSEFKYPFFVKPARLGSSVGITRIRNEHQIHKAFQLAFSFDEKILVEEGIKGREIECSILGNDQPLASLPGEIAPSREFYDYRDKYLEGKAGLYAPASLPEATIQKIQNLAIQAFKSIDCAGMARVDFFLQEKTENIFLNEINTLPGFTKISMYPKLWEVSGIPYQSLLEKLIELGLERHKNRYNSKF